MQKFLAEYQETFDQDTGIEYSGAERQHQLYQQLRERVGPALAHQYDLDVAPLAEPLRGDLMRLATLRGIAVSLLPELSIVTAQTTDGDQTFTLIHNDAHTNVASIGGESKRRTPDEDTLTVVPGVLGAYPNVLQFAGRGPLGVHQRGGGASR